MATSTRDNDGHDDEIRLWREGDMWIAKDIETGVASQGQSRTEALENLDDAVALRNDEIGHEPTEEELEAAGIDPQANSTGDQEPPDILR